MKNGFYFFITRRLLWYTIPAYGYYKQAKYKYVDYIYGYD